MASQSQSQPTQPRSSILLASVEPAGYYTGTKLLNLHAYIDQTSPWQAAATILAAPVPGFVAALIPAFLPLQPLQSGATVSFYSHVFFIVLFITGGAVASCLDVTQVPSSVYSLREVALVSLICAGLVVLLSSPLFAFWRFPVPFYWIVGVALWYVSAVVAHLLVLRSKCWRCPELLAAVRLYGIGLSIQVLQLLIYPAISVLFDYVGGNYQIGAALLVPVIKICIKRCLKFATRDLEDQHGVVVVCAVEICSSLYQSMIMQSAPSYVALIVLMVLDVVHGLVSIKFFLDRPSSVPHKELVPRALRMLRKQRVVPSKHNVKSSAKTSGTVAPSIESSPETGLAKAKAPSVRTASRVNHREIVNQALLVTHIAETILLVEYFEVIVPLVNCVFLLITSQLPSSAFNTRLSVFYHNPLKLAQATKSILLYASLQALSFVAMHMVMKYRYGLSAGYQLAFVLKHHRVPIQGKMIAWLPVMLFFTTAHYGTDFSFRFQFNTWDQW